MSAGGDACWSREGGNSRRQRDNVGETQLSSQRAAPLPLLEETRLGSAPGGAWARVRVAPPSAEEAFC